jgi:hypothetical protein
MGDIAASSREPSSRRVVIHMLKTKYDGVLSKKGFGTLIVGPTVVRSSERACPEQAEVRTRSSALALWHIVSHNCANME